MPQIYIKNYYLCIDILYPKHSLRSRSSREIVTAFLCCFDWQKRQNLSKEKTILRQKATQQPNNQYFASSKKNKKRRF